MDATTIALQGTLAAFMAGMNPGTGATRPPSLLGRLAPLVFGWELLEPFQVDTYSKQLVGPVLAQAHALDRKGRALGHDGEACLNFASQDYLGLGHHPAVIEAARQALHTQGPHAAGSPALMGNSPQSLALEDALGQWLGMASVALFPTGWAAGYGAIRALVRPTDHILIDRLAHACLAEGARAATPNVHTFAHASTESLAEALARLRTEHPAAGILIVTESLFSMDSDVPDLRAMQALARRHEATLLVDVAHDLGSLAEGGRGALEAQGMLGQVDVVMGSFSKTFSSNGGFVASQEPGLKLAIRYGCGPHTFSSALSPVQLAVVRQALAVVRSAEGQALRARLMANAVHLRRRLVDAGHAVIGEPSAVVPVVVGPQAHSRLLTRFMLAQGMLVNLVEHPAVPRDGSRLRLQLMAQHTTDQLDRLVDALRVASVQARQELDGINALRQAQGQDLLS